jgi:hypothetical protein
MDSPIPDLIGMSQSVARDVAAKTHMIKVFAELNGDTPRCLVGFLDRSVEQRPCTEIGSSKKSV